MRQSYWFNRSFTTVILTIIAVSCTLQEPVFFIDDYSVNGKYRISDIITEENLVKDTVLFNGMAALFNEFNKEGYGNWYGYWHIAQEKHGELILRMNNDDTYDVVLVCQDSDSGKYSFHHTARSYGDGADFEQMYSTLKEDILHKTIIKGYYPYVIQSDTLVNNIPTVSETQVIADTTTIQERINTGKHRFQQKTQ